MPKNNEIWAIINDNSPLKNDKIKVNLNKIIIDESIDKGSKISFDINIMGIELWIRNIIEIRKNHGNNT